RADPGAPRRGLGPRDPRRGAHSGGARRKFGKTRRIHLVGIGGSGMSGIAEVLLNLGYTVTGSDLAAGETVARLRRRGARVWIGHDARHVAKAEVVVTSSAVAPDNIEVLEARRRDVPIIPRAEMLAEL